MLSQYVQNQPAIYRMCRNAMIYRFVANDKNFTSQGKNVNHVGATLIVAIFLRGEGVRKEKKGMREEGKGMFESSR